MSRIIVCGNDCGHDHESANGPSGCCSEHGPFLYSCPECQEEWAKANPEKVAKIDRMVRAAHKRAGIVKDGPR